MHASISEPSAPSRARTSASLGRRFVAAISLVSLIASGCGGARYANVARAPSPVAAEAAASTMAGPAGGAPAAETWKRSQIAANTARVMVGDREELPLRGLQAQVTIDGFRARVILDY